jgi:hypothetical protein
MPERAVTPAALPQPVTLSSAQLALAQVAFLVSPFPESRPAVACPTIACQDAITVGSPMRLNQVAWNEARGPAPGRRRGSDTFSLASAAVRLWVDRDPRNGSG